MAVKKIHFVGISARESDHVRMKALSDRFEFGYEKINSSDELLDHANSLDHVPLCAVVCLNMKKEEIAGNLQVVRQTCKEAFIVTILGKKVPVEEAQFIKKSGSNLVIFEEAFLEASHLEYIASQIVRGSYIPMKAAELKKEQSFEFSLYHLLPLNNKMLPILPAGTVLTESRFAKMDGIGEFYLKREDIGAYKKYLETAKDLTAAGLKSRCRAHYMNLCWSHAQLIFLLLDQSEASSFQEGKRLLESCEALAKEMLTTLASVGEAWDVVNSSSIGEGSSAERCPTLAAYAGLMSLISSIGDTTTVMVSALLCDVGLLDLHPALSVEMSRVQGNFMLLKGADRAAYEQHPIMGINRCLSRKLPIPDKIKQIILSTHERADLKGFPNQPIPDRIPIEAQLIQFSELVDQRSMTRMGQARRSASEVRSETFMEEFQNASRFTIDFLSKVKSSI